jgi:hypothetical protein
MAARLQISEDPLIHTLADDLESFLHVLSWVALRYMSHKLDAEALTDLMVMFEASFQAKDGTIRGGRAKKNYLIGGEVWKSGFRNRTMASLLQVLTRTVATRYEAAPTGRDEDQGLNFRLPGPESTHHTVMENVARYQARLAALETSDWMLQTFREATSNPDAWPTNDESVQNEMVFPPPPVLKRKSDIDSDRPRQKRRSLHLSK